jgi:acyl dehydratase
VNPVGPDQIIFDLEALPALEGHQFEGGWFSVTAEQILQFDASTFVVDDDYGTSLEDYPVGMLEGMHTLGVLPQLVDSGFRMEDSDAYALVYGFERVRFLTRVFTGDRLRARGTVVEVRPRGHGYVTRLDCTIDIEGRDSPAYVCEWLVYYLPTESAIRARAAGEESA